MVVFLSYGCVVFRCVCTTSSLPIHLGGESLLLKKQAPPRLRLRPGGRRASVSTATLPLPARAAWRPRRSRRGGFGFRPGARPGFRAHLRPPRAPGGPPRPLSAGQRRAAGPGPAFPLLGRAGAVPGRRRADPTHGERRSSKTRCKNTLPSEARRGGPRPRRSTSGCAGRPSACRARESPGPRGPRAPPRRSRAGTLAGRPRPQLRRRPAPYP